MKEKQSRLHMIKGGPGGKQHCFNPGQTPKGNDYEPEPAGSRTTKARGGGRKIKSRGQIPQRRLKGDLRGNAKRGGKILLGTGRTKKKTRVNNQVRMKKEW